MTPPPEPDDIETYRPTSRRQRLVIVAVTVATVVTLWMLLIYRPGGHPRNYAAPPPAPCAPGQTRACIGGQADVTLVPAEPPDAASAAATR